MANRETIRKQHAGREKARTPRGDAKPGGIVGFLGRLLRGVKKHSPARRPESDIEGKAHPRAGIPRSPERERLMAGDAELDMAMRAAAGGVERTLFSQGPRLGGGRISARFDSALTTEDNRRHWSMADGLAADAAANPNKGLNAGECLFTACSGSRRGQEDWEVTFRFAGSPNVADWCADWPSGVKPSAAVPKKGWEYAWVRYKTGKGTNNYIPKPMSVHIEQVYRSGGFGALNIGT